MSDQHTSGPWHIFSVYAQHEVRTPSGSLVAVVNNRRDARLIAASPDLLDALRKTKTCALPTEVRELVNDAIAKASAGQPAQGGGA